MYSQKPPWFPVSTFGSKRMGKKSISRSTLSQLLSLQLVQQTRSISSDVSFHTSSQTDTPEDTK